MTVSIWSPYGASPDELGTTSGITVVNTFEDLKDIVDINGIAITRGYYEPGDGGSAMYFLQDDSIPSPAQNGISIITRTDSRWYKIHIPGPYIGSKQCGLKGDNITVEHTLLDKAMRLCEAELKKGILLQGRIVISETLFVDYPIDIKFEGSTGIPATYAKAFAQSYIVGKNVTYDPDRPALVVLVHNGITVEGGGVLGDWDPGTGLGWQYDGLFIGGHGIRWTQGDFKYVGRDGIRCGDYAGVSLTNTNCFYLEKCTSSFNGRDGLHISDDAFPEDVNAFTVTSFEAKNNGNCGIYVGAAGLGGTFIAPNCEANSVGFKISNYNMGPIIVIGGDLEANTTNLIDESKGFRLTLLGTVIQGYTKHSVGEFTVSTVRPFTTDLTVSNTDIAVNASARISLVTSQGRSVVLQRSAAAGGALLIGGADHAGSVALVLNNLTKWEFKSDGSLALSGDVGATGQVLTSNGPGLAARWLPVGALTFVDKSGDTMTGDLTLQSAGLIDLDVISTADSARAGATGALTATLGVTSGTVNAGLIATAATNVAEFGTQSSHSLRILTNNIARYTIDAAGAFHIGTSNPGTAGQLLSSQGVGLPLQWITASGTGTVTSVGCSVPTGMSISGSPITAAGTLAISWAAGYTGYTSVEQTKLSGLPATAVSKTGDTMSGNLTVNTANAVIEATGTNTTVRSIGSSGAIVALGVGALQGGMSTSGAFLEVGTMTAHEVVISMGASPKIRLNTSGYIELLGLPGSSPGGTNRLWRDGSGFVRIT
jgi:hypothetical protein